MEIPTQSVDIPDSLPQTPLAPVILAVILSIIIIR